MTDPSAATPASQAVSYPLAAAPGPGEVIEVAPGVLWLRMSLPLALNHINLWALEDDGGWTLIDTGMQTDDIVPQLRLLISGDQVLPQITSNVSVFPTEPEADPLTDWLKSLAAVALEVPDDVLVLPSHNEPFLGLHARIQQLIDGHEQALERLRDALSERKTASDVFGLLFRRRVGPEMLPMATGESIAHLNCLVRRGQAARELDAQGVLWYERR